MNHQWIDIGVILIANMFNILIVGIMLARPRNMKRLEQTLGLIAAMFALPLFFTVAYNWLNQRTIWMVALPGLLALHSLIEFLLDYVFNYPFRQTRWLGPYLLLFYAAQWGMIGFGFIFGQIAGIVTLLTYFLSLAATGYSYKMVGHGQRRQDG